MSSPLASGSIPQPPGYEEQSSSATSVQWLEGTHTAERTIRLQYNPDPMGGVNTLDEKQSGTTPGLGAYDLRLFSDVVSCGLAK